MSWTDLSPREAHDALAGNPDLRVLDVRTQPEHDSHRIQGAQLLPVQEIEARVGELDVDAAYLVVCEHGMRSMAACGFLTQHGFGDLRNLRGGMAAWLAEGLPHER